MPSRAKKLDHAVATLPSIPRHMRGTDRETGKLFCYASPETMPLGATV